MVDAPVSGAEWGAKAAELVFMCGGEAADIERVRPLLEVMGKACSISARSAPATP